MDKKKLTARQERFCQEYINCMNATQSAIKAGYSAKTAKEMAVENLSKPNIVERLKELQKPVIEKFEITREKLMNEYAKIGFSSIAHLHNSWIELKDFDSLTQEQKDCICEIQRSVRKVKNNNDTYDDVEFVKIKLYDKLKALDSIKNMLGFDAPIKQETQTTQINYNIPDDGRNEY